MLLVFFIYFLFLFFIYKLINSFWLSHQQHDTAFDSLYDLINVLGLKEKSRNKGTSFCVFPNNLYCLQEYACTFQPKNFTCWGKEGIKTFFFLILCTSTLLMTHPPFHIHDENVKH